MMKWLEELSDNVKGWFLTHGSNPLLWTLLFFFGIFVFWITYKALTKNHN